MNQLSLFASKPESNTREISDAGRDDLRRYLRGELRQARRATSLPWHEDEVERIEAAFVRYCRHLPREEAAEYLNGLQTELERLRRPAISRSGA